MTTKVNPMLATLIENGGRRPDPEAPQRLVLVYTGEPGEGKTHNYLTMPEPIVIFNVDFGLEGVIEKFSDKDIVIVDVTWPDVGEQADYRRIWDEMMGKLKLALAGLKGTGGSVVFDTFTELVELAEWAFVGKINEIPPTRHKQYQAPLRAIVRDVMAAGVNGAFIHKYGPVYGRPQDSEIKGYRDMQYQAQAVVLCTRDENGNRVQEILKCRANGPLQGMTLPAMDFINLAKMVHEG